jgi:hypothetical protein
LASFNEAVAPNPLQTLTKEPAAGRDFVMGVERWEKDWIYAALNISIRASGSLFNNLLKDKSYISVTSTLSR